MNSNEKRSFNSERVLICVRGIPGSGKSTFAEMMARRNIDKILSADMFFEDESGNYEWVGEKLRYAHEWCYDQVEKYLLNDTPRVFVANVLNRERDVREYKELAEKHNYEFVSVIMENRNQQVSIHDVPEENISKMVNKFSVKL